MLGQLTLGLILLLMTGMQGVHGQQCSDVAENDFDDLCITQSGDGTATAVMSNILDVYDLSTGSAGTDGIGDVQLTMEAVVCNTGCGSGGPYEIGACIGDAFAGIGSNSSGSDFGTDFNAAIDDETTCEGAGGYIVITIDFLNGFSSTAAGFDLPQGSNNGESEGYEGTFGWVTAGTDATGMALTGLPSVNMGLFCNYTSSDYATTQMSTFVGATGAGSWQTDSQNTTPNQTGGTMNSDANGQNICSGAGATTAQNGEDTASGIGADQGVDAATANPNLGLAATDIITQVKYVYFYSSTPSIDCDGDGLTAANSDPAQSWSGFDFCGPPPPPLACGTCTGTGGLFVTEVNSGAGTDGSCEYVEIFNAYNNAITTSASTTITISGGVTYTFPVGTVIPAGGYVVIARSTSGISSASNCPFMGVATTHQFSGSLTATEDVTVSLVCSDDPTVNFSNTAEGGSASETTTRHYPIDGSASAVGAPSPGTGTCTGCADAEFSCVAPCPDLTSLTSGMLDVGVTEATCTDGAPSGGSVTAPTTACPEGSSLMYSTDGGMNWSETLPSYNQTEPITVDTRCECDTDDTAVSPTSSVTTDPPLCPAITITKSNGDNSGDSQTLTPAMDAEFTIEVCNSGTENLCELVIAESATDADLDVSDCVPDAAAIATLIAGAGDMDADFEPMECFTFTCETSTVTEDFTNTISITAEGCDSGDEVEDDDPSEVVIDCPDGTTFTQSAVVCEGEEVTFTVNPDGPVGTLNHRFWKDANGDGIEDAGEFLGQVGFSNAWITTNVTNMEAICVSFNYAGSCPETICLVAELHELPSVTLDDVSNCLGDGDVTLDAGAGFSTYAWSNGAATQTITITDAIMAATTYSVTVTDANGCETVEEAEVTILESPMATVQNITVCEGATSAPFVYTSECTIHSFLIDYYAPAPGFTSVAVASPNTPPTTIALPSGLTAGSVYNGVLTLGCDNECSASVDFSITVVAGPTVTLDDETICLGESVTLEATGGDSYEWSDGTMTATLTVSPTATTTYTVTVTDANGCTATADAEVLVNDSPVCEANVEADCLGGDLEFGETGGDADSWSWEGPNGFTSTLQSPTVNGTIAADYGTYTVTVTDANGCTNTCEVEASMPSPPVLNEDAFIRACEDPFGSFMADFNLADAEDLANGDVDGDGADGSTATVTYYLNMADALACTNPLSNGMDLLPNPIFAKVEAANGCFSVVQVGINMSRPPSYTAIATAASTCLSSDGSITFLGLDSGVGLDLFYTGPAGNPVSGTQVTISATGTFTLTGLSSTTYTGIYLVETYADDLQCSGMILEIEVPEPDPPVIDILDIVVCEGATTVPIEYTSDCDNIINFRLDFASEEMNEGFMNMSLDGEIVFTIPDGIAPGEYEGIGTITCDNHCFSSAPFTITVVEDPELTFTQTNDGCTGEELIFAVTATGGAGSPVYTFYTDADFDGFEETLQTGASDTLRSTSIPNGATLRVECSAAGDCIAEESLTVVREEPCPIYDVALMKTLTSTGPFAIGDVVSFDIVVLNQGNLPVYNVLVEDYLPVGLDFCAADNTANLFMSNPDTAGGRTVMAMVATIPAGGMVALSIELKVGAAAQNGTIFNVAEITSATEDEDGMNPIDDEDDDLSDTDNGLDDETDDEIDDETAGGMDNSMDEDDLDYAALVICTVGCNGTFPWDGQ